MMTLVGRQQQHQQQRQMKKMCGETWSCKKNEDYNEA